MEIRDLRIVKTIAEHGTLVRAARVLGTAQPALTRSLAAIEARLRGKLFERTRRGVVLTDLGRTVMAEAGEILQRLERLGERLDAVRGDQVRELRILAGPFVGESIGVMALARMIARHPEVRMRLATSNWAEIPRAILEREASVGLLALQDLDEDPNLHVERAPAARRVPRPPRPSPVAQARHGAGGHPRPSAGIHRPRPARGARADGGGPPCREACRRRPRRLSGPRHREPDLVHRRPAALGRGHRRPRPYRHADDARRRRGRPALARAMARAASGHPDPARRAARRGRARLPLATARRRRRGGGEVDRLVPAQRHRPADLNAGGGIHRPRRRRVSTCAGRR
ncbi:MAG: LysR family transcriptional regulator [Alphaproteobacteria bacterium]|nr:LysR family transcriptional regulator [Alphaproteobacteria bacterium]